MDDAVDREVVGWTRVVDVDDGIAAVLAGRTPATLRRGGAAVDALPGDQEEADPREAGGDLVGGVVAVVSEARRTAGLPGLSPLVGHLLLEVLEQPVKIAVAVGACRCGRLEAGVPDRAHEPHEELWRARGQALAAHAFAHLP